MSTFDITNPFARRPRRLARLPRLVRLYLLNCVIGFVLAGVFTGLILWTNIGNIRHLVMAVEGGWLAGAIFFVLNGIVFAGVQTGIVIMSMTYGRDDPPKRKRPSASPCRYLPAAAPAPVDRPAKHP